jgi:hypothetical protein
LRQGWINHHHIGRYKDPEWTATHVVIHGDNYFKCVFGSGSGEDAHHEQPQVTQGFVQHLGWKLLLLQDYWELGDD